MELKTVRNVYINAWSEEKSYINNNEIFIVFSEMKLRFSYSKKSIVSHKGMICILSGIRGVVSIYNDSDHPICIKGMILQLEFIAPNSEVVMFDKLNVNYKLIHKTFETLELKVELYNLVLDLLTSEKLTERDKGLIDPRLIKVNRYIRKNYNKKIKLHQLSKMIDVHPTYLCNQYSLVFNVSPIYHLNQYRIKRAILLLKETDLSIKEIANQVGYSSAAHFSTVFRRYQSKTPLDFRK